MNGWELFLIAVGLSMDAFAVSVCKGLAVEQVKGKHVVTAGLYFGGFQAAMPLAGYLLGVSFQETIMFIDHWIAFVLLGMIGMNMIREAMGKEEEKVDASFGPGVMLPMAVATSIDAFAIGVTFAFLQVDILPAVSLIGVVTFLFSAAGIKIGNVFGARYKAKAEFFGGVILVLMGIKILVEHLLS